MQNRRKTLKDLYGYSDNQIDSISQEDQDTLLKNDFETNDFAPEQQGVVESGKMTADQLSAERENTGMSNAQKVSLVKGINSALGKMAGGDPMGASRYRGLQTIRQNRPEDAMAARRQALRNLLGR